MSALPAPSPSASSATMPTASMQASPATSASETVGDASERENGQRAVDRLVANVEIAALTRALRARLAYASFKASTGCVQLTIDDLERDLASKAAANASSTASLKRRAPPSAMGPPVSPSPSLYNSVLASPPPAKRARHTQQGALLPPPRASPRSSLRAQAARSPRNAGQRPSHRADAIAGSSSQPSEPDAISAAATLTSLLLTSRSPRSAPVSRTSSGVSVSQSSHLASSSQGTHLDAPFPGSPSQRTHTPPSRKTDDVKEAAELMLYLATSPSPAQVHSKAASNKDRAAGVGRVLFPGASSRASDAPGSPLRRETTAAVPQSPPSASRAFSPARTPSQPTSNVLTPKSAGFNINDYINVSPSPSAPPPSYFASGSSGYRPNMATAGRRLFEEETSAASSQRRNMFGEEPTSLGAGIDLVNAA
ncbi:hypothetical protein AURDEDRAFT_182692 [Auricularia subglabra TFB-10046 SS5]|nr:hypothetical protein AURDEDRAFT_182692 [Auricularia subglabra TFB-10046 SS5]